MTFEMATAVFQIRNLSDDKYLAFIMTHFLLIMPHQWFGIIKANVMLMHAIVTILHHDIILSSKNEQKYRNYKGPSYNQL